MGWRSDLCCMMYETTQQKGDHAELRVASRLKWHGWTVLEPFTDNKKYDLVAEDDGEFVRIQVKSARGDDGSVTFSCYGPNSSKSGNNRTDYTSDDIEGIAVYARHADDYFWVPVDDLNRHTMTVNLSDDTATNPASEYRFADRFGDGRND